MTSAVDQGSRSNLAEDRAEYSFTGRGITWLGQRCESCGMADVYVDGTLATSVDTYAKPVLSDSLNVDHDRSVPLFTHRWPAAGRHAVTIVVRPDANLWAKGHFVYLDALLVTP